MESLSRTSRYSTSFPRSWPTMTVDPTGQNNTASPPIPSDKNTKSMTTFSRSSTRSIRRVDGDVVIRRGISARMAGCRMGRDQRRPRRARGTWHLANRVWGSALQEYSDDCYNTEHSILRRGLYDYTIDGREISDDGCMTNHLRRHRVLVSALGP